jgi:hypothetical protein
MRRLGRWLLNASTALSLLLCAATAGMWMRSYRTYDTLSLTDQNRQHIAVCSSLLGKLRYRDASCVNGFRGHDGWAFESLPAYPRWGWEHEQPTLRRWSVLGVTYFSGTWTPVVPLTRTLVVPFGWVVAVTLLLPLGRVSVIVRRRWRRHMERRNLCTACSYDLIGNVSGVCPECGTAIVKGNV